MKIAENCAVSLDYSLHLGDGVIVDSSEPGEPLTYLHGAGQLVPGLERELSGMALGESRRVVVAPADGYGERVPGRVQTVPMSAFGGDTVAAGDEFMATDPQGQPLPVRVVKVAGDQVTVDMNHPLAGETLHFSVEVRAVRPATADELTHGHVHGADGHHH